MDEKNKRAVEIYNEIAEEYSKNYDSIDGEEDLIFLRTFLAHLSPGSSLIDLGCGTGFSTGWFKKNGIEVEGLDLSSKMIEIARRNYPTIKFSIVDMRTFHPGNEVDAVWAGYSMFHFDQNDFEKTIENIKTYLKPGGVFGLVMQEGNGEVEIPEPFLPDKTIYLHLYSEDELSEILTQYGFEVTGRERKLAQHPNEFAYNKLLLIGRLNTFSKTH